MMEILTQKRGVQHKRRVIFEDSEGEKAGIGNESSKKESRVVSVEPERRSQRDVTFASAFIALSGISGLLETMLPVVRDHTPSHP